MKGPKCTISICADPNFAMQFASNPDFRILYVGEQLGANQLPPGIIPFSILLPPYQALEAEINNNMQAYIQIYTQHLLTGSALEAIKTIIVSLWAGKNIVLLVENGNNLSHMKFLVDYLINVYGITPATEMNPFSFNPEKSILIAGVLYTFNGGYITSTDFLREVPDVNTLIQVSSSPVFKGELLAKLSMEIYGRFLPAEIIINELGNYLSKIRNGAQQLFTFLPQQ